MEHMEVITLQRARDFSRRLNATFEFIKQNFRGLFKALLYIAGPSVLLASALLATMASDLFSVFSGAIGNPEVINAYFLSVSFWLQIALMMILFFVSSCMTLATINNYIILYDEKKTNRIPVQDVWDRVRASFWMYAGSMVMFFLLFMAVYVAMIFVSMLFALVSPFLLFLMMFAVYLAIIYFIVSASMTFFIRSYEKKDFFTALSRSFRLIRGKWWSTFGYAVVIYLITSTIASLFIMPFYVLFFVQMLHDVDSVQGPEFTTGAQWSLIIMFTVYYAVSIILNMLPNVSIAFQYFNLVELKESRGLISQFENFGQQHLPPTDEEQY